MSDAVSSALRARLKRLDEDDMSTARNIQWLEADLVKAREAQAAIRAERADIQNHIKEHNL